MRTRRELLAAAAWMLPPLAGQKRESARGIKPEGPDASQGGFKLPPAATGRRRALVVANAKYAASPLQNPAHDGVDVRAKLAGLGFEATLLADANLAALNRGLDVFAREVQKGDVVMFHYSGHGFQIDGVNYVVPTDYSARDEAAARNASLAVREVQTRLERSPAAAVILTLDACRTHPFRARPETRGLSPLESGLGTYICFAAAPGQTADDNSSERNGLFTKHLLAALDRAAGIADTFRGVRRAVFDASESRQLPYLHDQLMREFQFREAAAGRPGGMAIPAGTSELMEAGRIAFHSGRCQEAFEAFDKASRQDIADPYAHHAAGAALVCLGRNAQAIERFRLAIQIKNDLAVSYMSRGVLYHGVGQFDLAVQDFTWTLEIEPQNGVAYWRRGHSLFLLRKYEDALQDYEESIRLNRTDANPYFGRGMVFTRLGPLPDAVRSFDAAIARKSDFGEAYRERGKAKERLRDRAGAEADLKKAALLGVLQ